MSNVLAPGAKDSVELPDGRQLAWSQWGPQDGHPVIFCTGAGMSGSLGLGADHLPELGLRLLAIDRPGLGRSTPHPTKTLATWTDDVRWLVEHRGLGQVATVGFSQGAPFAFALAGSGAAHAIAIAAGQDDMHHLLPDEGGAILWTRSREILEGVRELIDRAAPQR